MAGNNQHYIPQFLQRGFASHKQGANSYTWEFRAGAAPANNKIKEIGAEYQFYTEPGNTLVDDTITKAENHYANLVNRLRAGPLGPVAEPDIPNFIAHLEVRTRHLRQSFLESGGYLLTKLMDQLSDPDTFGALVLRKMENDRSWLRSEVIQQLRKQPRPPRDMNGEVNRMMKTAASWMPVFLEAQKPMIAAMIAALKIQLPSRLEPAIKAGHLRALKQTIEPKARSDAFAALKFRVLDTLDVNLILGDSGTLFQIGDVGTFRPYTEKDTNVLAVFLPLTLNRILIGQPQTTDWDFAMLKRQLARCSLEYFIAHEDTAENRTLQNEIGTDASFMTKHQLEELAVECFQNLTRPTQ